MSESATSPSCSATTTASDSRSSGWSCLSAMTPMVTKLSLTSLAVTGSVVGRLSSIGTAGSIVGTVVTGFVLISRVPVSGILVGLGVALLAAALLVVVGLRPSTRPSGRAVAGCAVLVAASGLAAGIVPDGCDVETTYHCAAVVTDPENPSGRILVGFLKSASGGCVQVCHG